MTIALDADARIAALHLRLGLVSLARAELEDLERRDALDPSDHAALAEARWRTGDLDRAADAARVHLDAGGDDPVAICIAAEAAAAAGLPSDAQELMDRLGPLDPAALDALFAGMPRRAHWPVAEVPPDRAAAPAPTAAVTSRRTVPGPEEVQAATAQGLWADEPAASGADLDEQPKTAADRGSRAQHDPRAELVAARAELGSEPERAILRLAVVLRLDPTLAPAVLDAVRLQREPAAALLRGDAQRLLGRHLEAEAAYAEAVDLLEPRPGRRGETSGPPGGHHRVRADHPPTPPTQEDS